MLMNSLSSDVTSVSSAAKHGLSQRICIKQITARQTSLEVKRENNLLTHYCHVTTVSKCRRGTSQFAVCGNVKPLKTERVNQPHPTVAYTNQTAHDLLEERKKKIFLTKMMMMRQTEDLDNDHPPPQISPQSALF